MTGAVIEARAAAMDSRVASRLAMTGQGTALRSADGDLARAAAAAALRTRELENVAGAVERQQFLLGPFQRGDLARVVAIEYVQAAQLDLDEINQSLESLF
jgi:hypothetical protein